MIGVDMGGTNTVFAIVDKTGYIIEKDSFPTKTPSVDVWADQLADGISRMIDSHSLQGDIVGIGIGAPSANATTGSIEGATNLPWPPPIPITNLMEARLGLPVKINNDAKDWEVIQKNDLLANLVADELAPVILPEYFHAKGEFKSLKIDT